MGNNSRKSQKVTRGLGILEDNLVSPLAEAVCKTRIAKKLSPNLMSFLKIIPAICFFLALFLISPIVSKIVGLALSLYIFSFLDRLDGAFARIQKKTSEFGRKLDSFIDKAFEIFILIFLGFYFNQESAFLLLAIFILAVSGIGAKNKNKGKRQEDLRDYYKNLDLLRLLALILLIITRNDIRRVMIVVSIALFSPMLLLYYFFGVYFLYLIRIITSRHKH